MIPSIPFVKYHGTGNDFILLDEREIDYQMNTEEISKLCHRHFGIGADGLISLRKAPDADFRMVYYNADGREGSMCGNGGRCIVAFARSLAVIGERTRFIGVDGYHEAMFLPDKPGFVSLKMSDVAAPRKRVGYDFIDTGSPHVVVAVRDLAGYPVVANGRSIRNLPEFSPGGTNVNFVEAVNDSLFIRTYERGVEDETMSCGTGVTAVVLTFAALAQLPASAREAQVMTPGGSLSVAFDRSEMGFSNVWLTGPAQRVFEGTYTR